MDIYDFKPGDKIMRVSPSTEGDRSYIGGECALIGVYSGVIFLLTPISRIFGKPSTLPCDQWQYNWELWPTTAEIAAAEVAIAKSEEQKESKGK